MKKFLTYLFFISFILSFNFKIQASEISKNNFEYKEIKLVFNGKEVTLLKPFILDKENNTLLMPLRDTLEAINHNIFSDQEKKIIEINNTASDEIIRKVVKVYDDIKDISISEYKILLNNNFLELDNNIISILDEKDNNFLVTYTPIEIILNKLDYVARFKNDTLFITSNLENISITERNKKIYYEKGKPFQEGEFIYVPLEETIKALGHQIEVTTEDIGKYILKIRFNTITLQEDSNEIIIGTPASESIIKVSSSGIINDENIHKQRHLKVQSSKVVDLVGKEENTLVPAKFYSNKNVLIKNEIAYVELSLLEKIFEIETINNNSNINIIDCQVKNFQIDGIPYQPNIPSDRLWVKIRRGENVVNENYYALNEFTDCKTGEIIVGEEKFDYLRERDFRDRIIACEKEETIKNTEFNKIFYNLHSSNILGFTKNGYAVADTMVENYYFLLDSNNGASYYLFYNIYHSRMFPG